MGNVVVTEFITLDGVVQDPHLWSFPYGTPETGKFKFDELQAQGAHLLGRVTYEGFAEAWPSRTDEWGFAERFNALPKYVVSTALQDAAWQGSTILRGSDLPTEIAQVKASIAGDIVVAGSVTLIQSLMQHKLVDEYRLLTYPLVLGEGRRLFGSVPTRLQLAESRPMGSTGVVLLRYVPALAGAA